MKRILTKMQRPHDGFLTLFLHSGDRGRQRAAADLERAAGVAGVKQQRPHLLTVEPTVASCTFSNCIFIISQLHYLQALCSLIMFFFKHLMTSQLEYCRCLLSVLVKKYYCIFVICARLQKTNSLTYSQ